MATIADIRKAVEIVKRIGYREQDPHTFAYLISKSEAQQRLDASHAWTVREAFVQLFASNPSFDAKEFRNECGPVAKRHYGEP